MEEQYEGKIKFYEIEINILFSNKYDKFKNLFGKMFGVTDNTIRKWCKSYSLPYQSSVINSISEEDWNQI